MVLILLNHALSNSALASNAWYLQETASQRVPPIVAI